MSGLYKVIQRIDEANGKYVDIGEGWVQLVVDCDAELAEIDPEYKVTQVKEKFGSLRFYFKQSDPSDRSVREKMDKIVQKYEEISSRTCQESGLPGIPMKSVGGWIKTLNPEHAAQKYPYARYTPVESNNEVV